MKIEHIAMWVKDLEIMREFYCRYFGGVANHKYHNSNTGFSSYFIRFASGARLELMHNSINHESTFRNNQIGYAHVAFPVASQDEVDELTNLLQQAGYIIKSFPRTTGDGYYESCIYDPEGNLVEITV